LRILGRRLAIALATGLVLAGCTTPSPAPSSPAAVDDGWKERGPITLAVEGGAGASMQQPVKEWNTAHPNEPVTLLELPSSGGQRTPGMAERARAGSGEYTVVSLESAATTEFAAEGWLTRLPASEFSTDGMAPPSVASATYDGGLYAYPFSQDAGLLYYRADLVERVNGKPPATWAELRTLCGRLTSQRSGLECYAGQLGSDPDLTSNVAEAIWSAGGELVTSEGTANVQTTAAGVGLRWLADGFTSGQIPKAALGWSADQARREFDSGRLVFLRDWWSARTEIVTNETQVGAKVGIIRLPGPGGAGVSAWGGRNLGISAKARNKGTAGDFVRFLTSEAQQRSLASRGVAAPVRTSVATDAALLKEVPSLKTLAEVLKTARPLPATTKFSQFTKDIREVCPPVFRGERTSTDALADLQQRFGQIFT
jgi:multiple sugar transport system substrate-binding protein